MTHKRNPIRSEGSGDWRGVLRSYTWPLETWPLHGGNTARSVERMMLPDCFVPSIHAARG